jgi:hypothetical protein
MNFKKTLDAQSLILSKQNERIYFLKKRKKYLKQRKCYYKDSNRELAILYEQTELEVSKLKQEKEELIRNNAEQSNKIIKLKNKFEKIL